MTGSRNLADYYHWDAADRGVRIFMHAVMADRLQAEVYDAGMEVGGILLGSVADDRATIVIDDFVPVSCARAGDSLNLEAALLRTALAGCEAPDAPVVLGFYRSHMRDGLSLSPDDLEVIDSYFQTPASVFLLVKTVAGSRACTAGFFFWEDGRIEPEFSSLEVALGRTAPLPSTGSEAADLAPPLGDPLNDDLPSDLAEMFRRAALPEPGVRAAAETDPPIESNKVRLAWQGLLFRAATIVIATVALVISVVTYFGASRPPREDAAGSTPASILGLQAERNPPDLLVTWNRNAREIVVARRATLCIRDGRTERIVELDKDRLARGSYLYTPASDDVQFRLEVYGPDDGSVAQSVRFSGGGGS
ncbi:MAG: hypothetical protein ABSF54_09040 [Bryobacteraceae bacterium]|jgi:hypothetical protein